MLISCNNSIDPPVLTISSLTTVGEQNSKNGLKLLRKDDPTLCLCLARLCGSNSTSSVSPASESSQQEEEKTVGCYQFICSDCLFCFFFLPWPTVRPRKWAALFKCLTEDSQSILFTCKLNVNDIVRRVDAGPNPCSSTRTLHVVVISGPRGCQ